MIDMNQRPAASPTAGRPGVADSAVEHIARLGWPVGAVSDRLGIAAPTLRSWDRRHGVGPSLRTSGNHRRYTELDISRVRLMARLTARGVPAQSAADSVLAMDAATILEQLGEDGESGDTGATTHGGDHTDRLDDGAALVEAIVAAARTLDGRTMAQLYRRVMRGSDVGKAWVEVFAPALRRVGDLWQEGRIGVHSEHLTSELLQSELRAVVRSNRLRVAGRPVVLAGADDEQHHLPLLALEAELSRNGVASLFLGPRVPSEALVSTLRESRARAVFLWASLPRQRNEALWAQLAVVDWPLEVVIGGPGWSEGIEALAGPVTLTRVDDFTSAVRALVSSPGGLSR